MSAAAMSGRGLTKQGTQNFVKFGLPFMAFVVIGSYGLSEWVGAKIRMKDEKRQQVSHKTARMHAVQATGRQAYLPVAAAAT